jgi:mRNA interferase MazF
MPAFNDFLVSGISSQIHQQIKDFDHLIDIQDNDFPQSGLKQSSLIRMNFLAVMNSSRMAGTIGKISVERHKYILKKLSDFKLSD